MNYVMNERMNGVFMIMHMTAVWKDIHNALKVHEWRNHDPLFSLAFLPCRDNLSNTQFIMELVWLGNFFSLRDNRGSQ